jgi:hypothetical protein
MCTHTLTYTHRHSECKRDQWADHKKLIDMASDSTLQVMFKILVKVWNIIKEEYP